MEIRGRDISKPTCFLCVCSPCFGGDRRKNRRRVLANVHRNCSRVAVSMPNLWFAHPSSPDCPNSLQGFAFAKEWCSKGNGPIYIEVDTYR